MDDAGRTDVNEWNEMKEWNEWMNEWMKEVVYFKSGYASPDLTGAKSHQKMMASLLDT